jgi:exopolysaccharide biosynthesis polyprenyl glycosylphosphotransferase
MARPIVGPSDLNFDVDLQAQVAAVEATVAVEAAAVIPQVRRSPSRPAVVSYVSKLSGTPAALAADLCSLAISIVIGAAVRQPLGAREGAGFLPSLVHELPYIPCYIMALALYGLYHRDRRRVRQTSFLDVGSRTHALAAGAVAILAISHLLHRFINGSLPEVGWAEVIFMTVPAALLVPVGRSSTNSLLRHSGGFRSRVVIVGSGVVATSLAQRLHNYPDIELLGFVDDDPFGGQPSSGYNQLGTIMDLPRVCVETGADRVLVAFSKTSPTWVAEMLRQLPAGVRISVVPRLFELVTWQSQIEELHGLTVMDVAPPKLGLFSRTMKRALDISVSSLLLLAMSPLLGAIALAVKLTSPGGVFFRQNRVGYRGRTFGIIKFRTMEQGADNIKIDLRDRSDVDGPLFKLHNDPRVTKVGRFLRSTSLDELPQLFNVLMGRMSLVGPRPFVVDESAAIDGWAVRRFDVRPGMTGLWQISGRNDLPFEELRQLDYAYVASWSLWWDLKILWHTPGSVLRRHGAY